MPRGRVLQADVDHVPRPVPHRRHSHLGPGQVDDHPGIVRGGEKECRVGGAQAAQCARNAGARADQAAHVQCCRHRGTDLAGCQPRQPCLANRFAAGFDDGLRRRQGGDIGSRRRLPPQFAMQDGETLGAHAETPELLWNP